jgi:hypothetical protein
LHPEPSHVPGILLRIRSRDNVLPGYQYDWPDAALITAALNKIVVAGLAIE